MSCHRGLLVSFSMFFPVLLSVFLAPYHKLLCTKCQVNWSIQVDTNCLRGYQPVKGYQEYAASIAEPALAVGTSVDLHTSQRQRHWVSTAKRATIPYCERGVLGTLRY